MKMVRFNDLLWHLVLNPLSIFGTSLASYTHWLCENSHLWNDIGTCPNRTHFHWYQTYQTNHSSRGASFMTHTWRSPTTWAWTLTNNTLDQHIFIAKAASIYQYPYYTAQHFGCLLLSINMVVSWLGLVVVDVFWEGFFFVFLVCFACLLLTLFPALLWRSF